jgi:soluble lytic murein transglycosylase-like protein
MVLKVVLLIAMCLAPLYGYSGIYGYVDERGVYHFTNMIPVGKKFKIIVPDQNATALVPDRDINWDNSNYDTLIMRHSTMHGVDPLLVKAVMKAESNFNPYARSPKGAQGLMQLMPDTARLMLVDNPYDPDENIKGGTKYLKFLDEMFRGDMELMLAGYNAGPNRVLEHNMKVPPIEETKTFIKRVKEYYKKIKKPNEG